MKTKLTFSALVALVLTFCAISSRATTGWVWAIRATGINSMHTSASVIDPAGNIYNCGNADNYPFPADSFVFGSHVVHNTTGNLSPLLITKTNAGGVFQWAISSQHVDVIVAGAVTDAAGNLIIMGVYYGDSIHLGNLIVPSPAGPSNQESFIAKISPAGSVLWIKNVLARAPYSVMPGLMHDIAIDAAGNVYVTGTHSESAIFLQGTKLNHTTSGIVATDVFLGKYNSAGVIQWGQTYGGERNDWNNTGGTTFGHPTKLLSVMASGHIYLIGESFSDSIKFGNTTLYNPAATTTTHGPHINYLVKCDTNGNPYWATQIDKHIHADCIISDGEERVYISGSLDSIATFGTTTVNAGALLCKFDSSGHSIWGKTIAGGNGNNICLDTARHIFMTGAIFDSMNITGTTLHKVNNDAIFIAEFDTAGTPLNAMQVGAGASKETFVNADKYGNIFVAGALFFAPTAFGSTTLDIIGASPSTTYTARYRYAEYGSVSVVTPTHKDIDVAIYPNPASDMINITAGEAIAGITITDGAGRLVFNRFGFNNTAAQVSIADLPSGIYYVSVNGVMAKKLVKN